MITEKDGTQVQGSELLPSAYFDISAKPGNSVVLTGGGYGHGVGMSQTGADRMAEQGYTCQEILEYFLKILKYCRLGLETPSAHVLVTGIFHGIIIK